MTEGAVDAVRRRAMLGVTAVSLLQERLEDPEIAARLSTKDLIEIADTNLGHLTPKNAPQQANNAGVPTVAVNVTFTAAPDRPALSPLIEATALPEGFDE